MVYSVIAPKSPDDVKADLLRLINRNFKNTSDDWYRWSYQQNPFGPNACWLVEADGELVGMTALMMREMKIGKQLLRVGQAANININPEHRSAQAAIKLQRALLDHVRREQIPLVFGVTETAVAVFRRVGYKPVGEVQRWVKPLRSEYKLKDRIRWTAPRKLAAFVTDVALKAKSAETWFRNPAGRRVDAPEDFSAQFEQFWNHQADKRSLWSTRNLPFLRWRFREEPQTDYRLLTITDSQTGWMLGYIVYSLPDPHDPDRFADVFDFAYHDPDVLKHLLAEVCRRLRHFHVDAISVRYFGREEVSDALAKFGFFRRPHDWQVLVYRNPDSEIDADMPLQSGNWHLTNAELLF